jgi:mannose-1-phosphate guanylyltransferase
VALALPALEPWQILTEPAGRNTAPAVALGAAWALERDPDPLLLVVPSDAWVGDVAVYGRALETAARAARDEPALVTIGVAPSRPETGYGYLEIGQEVPGQPDVHRVARFVEKPHAIAAARFVTGGRHLWNCGIFVMRALVFVEALEKHLPEVAGPLAALRTAGLGAAGAVEAYYGAVPSISIDYGVMERAERVLAVRGTFPWDDLGSWVALERTHPRDDRGNVVHGEVLTLDCDGCVLYSTEGLLATLGLQNVVVVRTGDVTLVVPKERAQEVRRLVQELGSPEERSRYR